MLKRFVLISDAHLAWTSQYCFDSDSYDECVKYQEKYAVDPYEYHTIIDLKFTPDYKIYKGTKLINGF